MNSTTKRLIKITFWIISLILIGSIIGSLTKPHINDWYQTLSRSPLTPPNYLFGIAWSILYAMIAVSGFLIWELKPCSKHKGKKGIYIAQIILNWSWTPLFFHYHLLGAASICLAAIIMLVTTLILKTYKDSPTAAILLVPYLLWLLFAMHLNFYIWQYN